MKNYIGHVLQVEFNVKRTFLAALNVFLIVSGNGPSLRFSVIIIQKNNKANMVFNEFGTQFLFFS